MTCQESDAMIERMLTNERGLEDFTRAERSALSSHVGGCARCCDKLVERGAIEAAKLSPAMIASSEIAGRAEGRRLALADMAANDPEAR